MNSKDAAVIKALAELGLRDEEDLTANQEHMFTVATDDEEQFYDEVIRLFKNSEKEVDK